MLALGRRHGMIAAVRVRGCWTHKIGHMEQLDIKDPTSAVSFDLPRDEGEAGMRGFFFAHPEHGLRGYLNQCTHMALELDMEDGDFFTGDGRYIQCKAHGALFECADGAAAGELSRLIVRWADVATAGPARPYQQLIQLPVSVQNDGSVHLGEDWRDVAENQRREQAERREGHRKRLAGKREGYKQRLKSESEKREEMSRKWEMKRQLMEVDQRFKRKLEHVKKPTW
eukprot:TRINITY_DN11670_c0_g1_i4.p1 TRINITY_DN11670_c0_g1~~TRINITY_DN11670_c0_g1_i4.p1  ORF type:complete len:227 (-),score=43.84 TRINITY_DN11670_c0_g1_i4:326-1006(-)